MNRIPMIGVWIIATGVIIALLYLARDILAPLALAVFLFLIMEGFARTIHRALDLPHLWLSRSAAILIVLGGFIGFVVMMARGVAQFGGAQAGEYEQRINGLIADAYGFIGMENAPSLTQLVFNETGQRFFTVLASALGDLSGDLVLILIYVAFLFLAEANWPSKLDQIFPEPDDRERVRLVGEQARRSIETYLWTQTLISAITTILTYISLLLLGVENALFLSALIFVLNYIPTLGSIVAAFVPPLFALVQPGLPAWVPFQSPADAYAYALVVFAAVSFWQFAIGNFLQPRMMGESLNLSALVVLIGLAVWGAIWGIPGMFLSAPLTVLLMILFAQGKQTHWIAVLLSADGQPKLVSVHGRAGAEPHGAAER